MRVVIFGATGGTGRCLLKQALMAGHRVSALARRPDSLAPFHGQVSVVTGNVLDAAAVNTAVAGQDAVLWAVGGHDAARNLLSGGHRQRDLCATGTGNVLEAMAHHAVRRLVALTSWGTGESRSRTPAPFRVFVFPVLMGAEMADKHRQETFIRYSGTDWTIVRPSRLTDGGRTGSYQVGPQLRYSIRSCISRADAAAFVLDQLSNPTWAHATVEITS
jgi:putative NADH-flavin reductase